jgi:hypothetical protein
MGAVILTRRKLGKSCGGGHGKNGSFEPPLTNFGIKLQQNAAAAHLHVYTYPIINPSVTFEIRRLRKFVG